MSRLAFLFPLHRHSPCGANANYIIDKNYIGSVLSQSLARAYDAYNLLDIIDFKPIIENTLIYGLPNKQNAVLNSQQEVKDE